MAGAIPLILLFFGLAVAFGLLSTGVEAITAVDKGLSKGRLDPNDPWGPNGAGTRHSALRDLDLTKEELRQGSSAAMLGFTDPKPPERTKEQKEQDELVLRALMRAQRPRPTSRPTVPPPPPPDSLMGGLFGPNRARALYMVRREQAIRDLERWVEEQQAKGR